MESLFPEACVMRPVKGCAMGVQGVQVRTFVARTKPAWTWYVVAA